MAHPTHHDQEAADDTRAEYLKIEGAVSLPHVTESASWIAEFCRRDGLDVLIDQGHPLGIMQRTDVFLHVSLHIYVATIRVGTRFLPCRS